MQDEDRPERMLDSVEGKFKALLCVTKPTDHGECPPEVLCVHHIDHLMENKEATHEKSSKPNAAASKSTNVPPMFVVKHIQAIKIEPDSTHPRIGTNQLCRTLDNVACSFNPKAVTTHEEACHSRTFKALHMQSLTTKLAESKSENSHLHDQWFQAHCDLDCETCHADNAQHNLDMYHLMHTQCMPETPVLPSNRGGSRPHPFSPSCTSPLQDQFPHTAFRSSPDRPTHQISEPSTSSSTANITQPFDVQDLEPIGLQDESCGQGWLGIN
ncbi:hypothetical protein M422DRAFT_242433 [Sphaerobolus stellatus SS14]|nr:hypothetical protein M422DRAFT_242433 [Sphaerobolus stellatus SS14]